MNQNDNSKIYNGPAAADDFFTISEDTTFSFDDSQDDEFVELDEEIIDQDEPGRRMACVCPKCAGKTDIDLTQVSENGFVISCSSCRKQIHIIRESCACRAKRKSFEINCVYCGKQLAQHAHCHTCGKLFPDYFVCVNPDDVRRKARSDFFSSKLAAIKDLRFSLKPSFDSPSRDDAAVYSPARRSVSAVSGASSVFSRKFAVLSTVLVVAIALIAASVIAYNSYKSGQVYAETYFKALYCIKTGFDTNLTNCTSLKTQWESTPGQGPSNSSGNKDDAKSLKLRSDIDKYMLMLSEPPKKYLQANANLTKIHKIYLDSEMLLASKPTSPQQFGGSIDSLNKNMSQASQELKSNLPEELQQELVTAKLKYRGLKDF